MHLNPFILQPASKAAHRALGILRPTVRIISPFGQTDRFARQQTGNHPG